MDATKAVELAGYLCNTLSTDQNERRKSEAYIKSVENHPGYALCLLGLIRDGTVPDPTRLAAAITFKNFIKSYWSHELEGLDRIAPADRESIRNQIIGSMLSLSGNMQYQLSEAIGYIWREDFPQKWPNLIPELVQRMAQMGADLTMVQGVLQTAHTLFKRYRHECAGDDLYREMKTVIEQFGQPLTELAKNLLALVVGDQRLTDGVRLIGVFRALLLVCKIFLSLNCQDLPEYFEDNIADWMAIFRSLLQLDTSIVQLVKAAAAGDTASTVSGDSSAAIVVEQVQSQVCDNASLYASKYEAEFSPYLPGLVTDVWELLVATSEHAKHDTLIGNAIEFLCSVISRPQHKHLFENPEILQKLCEKVILPNMHFRALDEELFSDQPEEYLRLDLEGSDAHTRRRAACHLVHVLCQAFEGPVVTTFSTYINHLLSEYANSLNSSAWLSKDAALLLVTSVAAKGKTEKHGVTVSTDLVNIPFFFETHVLPELQHANADHLPVIKADCIRYAIAFRSLLSPAAIIGLINLLPHLLTAATPVVHSYAAALTDKLLAMRHPENPIKPLITKEQVGEPQLLIERLLAVLMMPDSSENVYVMRAIMRTCCCLQDKCLPSMQSLVTTILSRLIQVAKNPSKPNFNHYLFETICLCIRITCASDASAILHFESALFPVVQEVLQNDISEFVPYVFQLTSVMLEQYPQSPMVQAAVRQSVNGVAPSASLKPSPPYSALLPRILVPSLWEQSGNVAALSRLVQAYLLHNMDEVINSNKLSAVLGVYQRLVPSAAYDIHAFTILSCLVLATPRDKMQPYLKQVFILIFRRLQSSKTDKFMKAFVLFISRFVVIYSPNELIAIIEDIQANLFGRVLEKVLIPYADLVISMPQTLSELRGSEQINAPASRIQWRQVSIGLTCLIGEAVALWPVPSALYAAFWPQLVGRIVSGLAAGPGRGGETAVEAAVTSTASTFGAEEQFVEVDADMTSQAAYCQLAFAVQHFPDLAPDVADPRVFLATTLHRISSMCPGEISQLLLNAGWDNQVTAYLQSCLTRAGIALT